MLAWIKTLQQLGETQPSALAPPPAQFGPAPVAGVQH